MRRGKEMSLIKNTEFAVHILNEDGIKKAKMIAAVFDDALEELKTLCLRSSSAGGITLPSHFLNGREFAIVKTKLEEASFFAKKAMAMLPENQKE